METFEKETSTPVPELGLPQAVIQALSKESGLLFLLGQRGDFLPETLHYVTREIAENTNRKTAVMTAVKKNYSNGQRVKYVVPQDNPLASVDCQNSDVLIFEWLKDSNDFLNLLNAAEEGRLVIIGMGAASVTNGLHKIFSLFSADIREHLLWRTSELLELVSHQTALFTPRGQLILAHEILLNTPEVKCHLQNGNLEGIEDLLSDPREKHGVVSKNQSLVQLLVRRKVDLKTAFGKTRDPQGLDALLKKLGF